LTICQKEEYDKFNMAKRKSKKVARVKKSSAKKTVNTHQNIVLTKEIVFMMVLFVGLVLLIKIIRILMANPLFLP